MSSTSQTNANSTPPVGLQSPQQQQQQETQSNQPKQPSGQPNVTTIPNQTQATDATNGNAPQLDPKLLEEAKKMGYDPEQLMNATPQQLFPLIVAMGMNVRDYKSKVDELKANEDILNKNKEAEMERFQTQVFDFMKETSGDAEAQKLSQNVLGLMADKPYGQALAELAPLKTILSHGHSLREENQRLKDELTRQRENQSVANSMLPQQRQVAPTNRSVDNSFVNQMIEQENKRNVANSYPQRSALSYTGNRFNPMAVKNAEAKGTPTTNQPAGRGVDTYPQNNNQHQQQQQPQQHQQDFQQNEETQAEPPMSGLMSRIGSSLNANPTFGADVTINVRAPQYKQQQSSGRRF